MNVLPLFTRRAFLGSIGVSVVARAGRVIGRRPYRIGVETYCFHDVDLAATLAHTKALGLRFLELHDGHLPRDASTVELARASAALRHSGITASGVYIHDAFTGDEAIARPIFEYARTMGFGYINGGPRADALPLLDRLVGEYGIEIAIHNHGPNSRYETLEHVVAALDAHRRLSACVDIGHFARSRVDPVAAIRRLAGRTVAVHVKDVDSRGENTILGDGTIDLPEVFSALAETSFDGLLVLEYEGDFDDMSARLDGMRKSLSVMQRLIARTGN